MRLMAAKIRNYRMLESIGLTFPSSYAAICGPNDSGKTNVVRALRAMVRGEGPNPSPFDDEEEFSRKDDYPKWKDAEPSKQDVSLEVIVELDKARDVGLYQFVVNQLKLDDVPNPLSLEMEVVYGEKAEPAVTVRTVGQPFTGLDAQQVLKKLQSLTVCIWRSRRITCPLV